MKKAIVTTIIMLTLGCGILGSNSCVVSYAATPGNTGANILATDVIEYKYRVHNGVPQYRRWNATKGKWVDPYWINI